MHYFIDIGNTRIKYTHNQLPFSICAIKHNDLTPLFDKLFRYQATKLLITAGRSSLAQKALSNITDFATTHQMAIEIVVVKPNLLKINYRDTTQFGVDRFLNLLASRKRHQSYFCIVSCGTAITLDFYTNEHIGGMILPGLNSSKQLLKEKAGLKFIEKPETLLGNSTATSIGAGIYFGYQNLIKESIVRIERKLNQHFTINFTGGDSQVLCQKGEIIPHLLFEGMQQYIAYEPTITTTQKI
ncbi:MAG: type III pantothenate kinase [Ostreibacterium sp.]